MSNGQTIHWGGEKAAKAHAGCPRDTNDPDDPRLCSKCRRVVRRRLERKAAK